MAPDVANEPAAIRGEILPAALSADALDDRIAIVGMAGSGKTYAAKGFIDPEQREFAFDPVRRALSNRGHYIAAALTIVLAYIAAGAPGRLRPIGSDEAWSDRVRSALVWLGESDPLVTQAELHEDDPGRLRRAGVFEAWSQLPPQLELTAKNGYLARELIAAAERFQPLHEALITIASGAGMKPIPGPWGATGGRRVNPGPSGACPRRSKAGSRATSTRRETGDRAREGAGIPSTARVACLEAFDCS